MVSNNWPRPIFTPGEGLLPAQTSGGAAGDFLAAKTLGLQHTNCADVFSSCPYEASQLFRILNNFAALPGLA
ncbi:hypothetical protein SK128_009538 [Halocaridina rubra]|uniref:Uncharacterized protein n=1 Tax=Halocaridina rubra TaxID=373956 RepID=A0AAN8XAC9_HALRR